MDGTEVSGCLRLESLGSLIRDAYVRTVMSNWWPVLSAIDIFFAEVDAADNVSFLVHLRTLSIYLCLSE